MFSLIARNVNDLYPKLLNLLHEHGVDENSRNGPVICLPAPLMVRVDCPQQRVLYDPLRNANPFFHLMEAMWMLDGRHDVEFVAQFNKQMYTYSDDGMVFNGAYGWRWRNYFTYDQVEKAINMLRKNKQDRRIVITMWDANRDLGSPSKDIPCNQQAIFRVVNGWLTMTTTNRSNDAVWGLAGANAVHLTMLQEYIAQATGLFCGPWYHMTNNLHLYKETHQHLLDNVTFPHHLVYPEGLNLLDKAVDPKAEAQNFNRELNRLLREGASYGPVNNFLARVVRPMWQGWELYKDDQLDAAIAHLEKYVAAPDWRIAGVQWLERVKEKRNEQL